MNKHLKNFNLFSERALVLLVSLVTLLLQLISFATTWDGAKVYLDGVFPYASLLFAIAIQATAYFFSNSLRKKKSFLKILALTLAICCSTYYSYIGIYNSVNSPLTYLQESYARISDTLTRQYDSQIALRLEELQSTVSGTVSRIIQKHQLLCSNLEHADACLEALDGVESDISTGMRAPKQASYANYEDYLAAYEAYINAKSSGNNLEQSASREGILASYGYADLEAVTREQSEINSKLVTLYSILQVSTPEEASLALTTLSARLGEEILRASQGEYADAAFQTQLNTLQQAASILEIADFSAADMKNTMKQCASLTSSDFMASYTLLAGENPQLKDAMDIKGRLDSEILSALLKINTLLSEDARISLTDGAYQITDVYIIPMTALTNAETRMTALFCLVMAGLVDGLSVLFAISLRGKSPLWKKRLLPLAPMDERYLSQIYAALPPGTAPTNGFRSFLQCFAPSPETEAQGYMLRASLEELAPFSLLAALLCQINLAKIVPAEVDNKEYLLLKAGFVFWVNDIIYQELLESGGMT